MSRCKIMVSITFINRDKTEIKVNAMVGCSLLDVVKENNIDLIGACDGNCACGSCHVYIDDETLKRIEPANEDEENVLDVVFNIKHNSRLACQVIVTNEMDGAVITIPE